MLCLDEVGSFFVYKYIFRDLCKIVYILMLFFILVVDMYFVGVEWKFVG